MADGFDQEYDSTQGVWRISYRASGNMAAPEEGEFLASVSSGLVDDKITARGDYRPSLVYNDDKAGVSVLSRLVQELDRLQDGDEFWFVVAFVKQSGLALLIQELDKLERRGVTGRVLTGTYLTFSEPMAFHTLMRYPNIETRIYNADFSGLHAKSYFFRHEGITDVLMGSSNLTQSALKGNKEWNLAVSSLQNGSLVRDASEAYERLWSAPETCALTDEFLESYTTEYERNKSRQVVPIEALATDATIEPNKMQEAALSKLAECRAAGEPRALVISATGTGKTYLAALDVRQTSPRPQRVLFVVHRERIAAAALKSFQKVLGDRYTYGLYGGGHADTDASCLFCTVQTLSRPENLAQFSPDAFDYIIIDEVHRAGASSYQRIVDHFTPSFLLGMSATPERNDEFDIYKMFNHVVAYEIRLQGALENHLVVPFHYFGVAEEDKPHSGTFEDAEIDRLAARVIDQSEKYGYSGPRVKGLVFCSGQREALGLADAMGRLGYRAVALVGTSSDDAREEAMCRLEQDDPEGALDYIVTVDVFNEGVDIPTVNQVIMVRPTDSAIIFVQQLGRGLRINPEKEYVNVIDFVGNYSNNYNIPVALNGDRSYQKETLRHLMASDGSFIPGPTTIQFDEISRERVLSSINKANFSRIRFIGEAYHHLRQRLGRIPSLEDFRQFGEASPELIFQCKGLGCYHVFLSKYEDEYHVTFDDAQVSFLRFVSTQLAEGKRSVELLLVRLLLEGDTTMEAFRQQVQASDVLQGVHQSDAQVSHDLDSALRVLDLSFFDKTMQRQFHSLCRLSEGGAIRRSGELSHALRDDEFVRQMREVVEYGLRTNRLSYGRPSGSSRLCIGQRYSRGDACRLLDWEKDEHGTVNGYSFKTDDWLVFVTYQKAGEISDSIRYEDRFVSPSTFVWFSQHNRGLGSKDARKLRTFDPSRQRIHLFVKKNDSEGPDHYYLGTMSFDPEDITEEMATDAKGGLAPILRVPFTLDQEVAPEIYRYLTS
jgi:superfamily II DNA or RNA helicase/HKD family nuclease